MSFRAIWTTQPVKTNLLGASAWFILLLHGGPGGTHEAFECFDGYFPNEEIEYIYYDQLDSYYSDKPNDSTLWTIDHFVEEVEQVRKALNLDSSNFYLLGQSWGGILAM